MFAQQFLIHWFSVTAQLVAMSVLLGPIKRYLPSIFFARLALGVVCGVFAAIEIARPFISIAGVVMDMRSIPVAIAAGFFGLPGSLACLVIAGTARILVGGAGAMPGVASLLLVSVGGYLWSLRYGVERSHSAFQLAILGLVPSFGLPFLLLVPHGVGERILLETSPFYIPFNIVGVMFVGWVIDRERTLLRQRQMLETESRTDFLTGLLNRRGLELGAKELGFSVVRSGIIVLDLDLFKAINDKFGHAAGDCALVELAKRIRTAVDQKNLVARLGGDEFAILIFPCAQPDIDRIVDRVREAVHRETVFVPCGAEVSISVSVGFSVGKQNDTFDSLMARADGVLYFDKTRNKKGRNSRQDSADLINLNVRRTTKINSRGHLANKD